MITTALDRLEVPPCSRLLGWRVLDARPEQGWVRIGFDGNAKFCNPAGFIQGGILTAMLDDTMGPAVFVMTEGAALHCDHHHDGQFSGARKGRADRRRGHRHADRQNDCFHGG